MEVWGRYFPNAKVLIGCDINPNCRALVYDDPRISVVVGDANTESTTAEILDKSDVFDIIIDDGSHRSSDIVKTFSNYFHVLVDDGVFAAEDLHCSYWREFEGGLYAPYSALSFFKRLADIVGQEHWGVQKTGPELLCGFSERYGATFEDVWLAHIHSVEFINSMCIIRKSLPEHNRLGKRIISGRSAQVAGDLMELALTTSKSPPQDNNALANMSAAPEEALFSLTAELGEKEARINFLNAELNAHKVLLSAIFASRSWRMKRILHKAGAALRKLIRTSGM